MKDIAVIIVNWNAREDLRACLLSLSAAPRPAVDYDVWVVDNASTDGSAAIVAGEFPQVHLIVNTENLGFSKANNQAIAASESRYVFLLNSDAAIHPGALDALTAYADAHPKGGIFGPQVRNSDGSLQLSCRRFPTAWAGLFRNTYLGRLFPHNRYAAEYLMIDIDHSRDRTVDWLSGCAMMIRRELIDKIGGLDERFYMYCEDVDICRRAWEAGAQVAYVPDAVVTHAIGRSSSNNAEQMIWEFHRSWFEFDKKHNPRSNSLRRAAIWSGLWLRATVRVTKARAQQRWARRASPIPVTEATSVAAQPNKSL